MNKAKIKIIAYWVTTVLTSGNYTFAGVLYIQGGPEVAKGMGQLGYPMYFITMLGVWKLLGAVAIIVPKMGLVKEWAYAGMFINLTGAAVSAAVVGLGAQHVILPLVFLAIVGASWALRPADRRLR